MKRNMARLHTWRGYMIRLTSGSPVVDLSWISSGSLTAAHCIKYKDRVNLRPSDISVFLGDHDSLATERYQKQRHVAEVIIHSNYDDITLNNDVALLRITPSLRRFTDYIRPICVAPGGISQRLLKKQGKLDGSQAGGRIRYNGPTPRFLKEVRPTLRRSQRMPKNHCCSVARKRFLCWIL